MLEIGRCVALADRPCIPFYGVIELTGRACDQVTSEIFIVSQLKEDAILGMPFLKRHKCYIDFSKSVVMLAGRELVCVDRFGRPLVGVCRWCGAASFLGAPGLQFTAE